MLHLLAGDLSNESQFMLGNACSSSEITKKDILITTPDGIFDL
jgi:hypothetical protein